MGCVSSRGEARVHAGGDNASGQLRQDLARCKRVMARQNAMLCVANLTKGSGHMTVDRLMAKIIEMAYLVAPSERVSLFIVDAPNKQLWARITKDGIPIKVAIGQGFVGCAAQSGEIVTVRDASKDTRFARETDDLTGFVTRSVVAMPVKDMHGDVVAVLEFINAARAGASEYEAEDIEGIKEFMPFIVDTIRHIASETFLDSAPPEIGMMLHHTFDYDTPAAARLAKFRRAARVTRASIVMMHNAGVKVRHKLKTTAEGDEAENDQPTMGRHTPGADSDDAGGDGGSDGDGDGDGDGNSDGGGGGDGSGDGGGDGGSGGESTGGGMEAVEVSQPQAGEPRALSTGEPQTLSPGQRDAFLGSPLAEPRKVLLARAQRVSWREHTYDAVAADTELDLVDDALSMLLSFKPGTLDIDDERLSRFCHALRVGYLPLPYHNFYHAMTAMHTCYQLLSATNSAGRCIADTLNPIQVIAALVAALAHDIGHTGRTNTFEIAVGSPLAVTYNDQSPLENHHTSTTFRLMRDDGCNFISTCTKERRTEFRSIVILGILATDMKCHKKHVERAQSLPVQDLSEGAEGQQDAQFVVPYLLHLADISNCIHEDFATVAFWSARVAEEFTLCTMAEEEAGLEVTPFMQGLDTGVAVARLQKGFFTFVALPLWAGAAAIYPHVQAYVERLEQNIRLIDDVATGKKTDGPSFEPRSRKVLCSSTGALEASAISGVLTQDRAPRSSTVARANSYERMSRHSWNQDKECS